MTTIDNMKDSLLSNMTLSRAIWWRMTWRQTLFAIFITLILYVFDGYHLLESLSHPKDIFTLIAEFAVEAPIIFISFTLFSVLILKRQIWKNKTSINGVETNILFSGSKQENKLTTLEALIVLVAISWRAWLLNGALLFFLWWIPGFFIISYLIAKLMAINWYATYPLGNLKLVIVNQEQPSKYGVKKR